ncbi:myophilin-like [Anneissia japonica]|uniref:myophilin-like n=1 Tax=Anneissia japonica TaxID=1529436 RepID=UPI001425A462|nr:myophilin-like [Anneissia japonica]
MANKGQAYGMSAAVQKKIEGKRKPGEEKDVRDFIVFHVGEEITYPDSLKDGVILCKLLKKFHPGFTKKIDTGNMSFKHRCNIENFIDGCKSFGLQEMELFQVNDLYESKNIAVVTSCIIALARHAQRVPGYEGPNLGPKQSTKNERHFTEEQLQAGKYIHSLQYGSNKGASQAGQNFGKPRQIFHDQ